MSAIDKAQAVRDLEASVRRALDAGLSGRLVVNIVQSIASPFR